MQTLDVWLKLTTDEWQVWQASGKFPRNDNEYDAATEGGQGLVALCERCGQAPACKWAVSFASRTRPTLSASVGPVKVIMLRAVLSRWKCLAPPAP